MKIRFNSLTLTCRSCVESIPFVDFSYFYGEMGAGKSTIARLIDFCLGSKQLVMTPALQSEFVAVGLDLDVAGTAVKLERERDSSQLLATWNDQQVVVPARTPAGSVLAETTVEVLSDLVFHIHGMIPPKVRRSQLNDESDLERLSLRDLLWYCYLDQDSMDSSFFNLDREAETFRRLKSRNVLRSLVGIHQEKVAELEAKLEDLRQTRQKFIEAAHVLGESLEKAGVSTVAEIDERLATLEKRRQHVSQEIQSVREAKKPLQGHATDKLRQAARHIASEIQAIEVAIGELHQTVSEDRRHVNEILALSTKVRRLDGARAVLNGVEFERCPRCTQFLPNRDEAACRVCGQGEEPNAGGTDTEADETKADIASRVKELEEMLDAQSTQIKRMTRRRDDLQRRKAEADQSLTAAMQEYDSAYLAEALELERHHASLGQESVYLKRIRTLPERVESLQSSGDNLAVEESATRRELKAAREAAEQDLSTLSRLAEFFLDCLIRARLAGFEPNDIVHMMPPWFLPEVMGATSGNLATTSFSTLGSGGKKNLFKCCFALAIHRLVADCETYLPTLLIIDSPMKNISERENRAQFEGFHQLLYELAETELRGTQFVLIDKEFCPPASAVTFSLSPRHMKVDDENEPPLIRKYRGK